MIFCPGKPVAIGLAVLFVWIGVSSFGGTRSFADEMDAQARKFLADFKVIRVGIRKSPGNGHQATAVSVMKRLRRLGFSGRFEIYCEPEIGKSLQFLIPGFRADGPPFQDLPYLGKAEIRRWTIGQSLPRTALGITGGDDAMTAPSALGVDAVIRVQPPDWYSPPTIEIAEGRKDKMASDVFRRFKRLPIRVSLPSPGSTLKTLRKQLRRTPALSAKIPGLEALFQNRSRVELLTAYGLGFEGPPKLETLVRAIDAARAAKPGAFRGGTVIPLLSNFNADEWAEFSNRLSLYPLLKDRLKIVDVTSSIAARQIEQLAPGEILILKTGGVPQDVWNLLMAASTLPPTISGTSGNNFLRQLGKPYLSTYFSAVYLPDQVKAASRLLALEQPDRIEKLAQYLLQGLDPQSDPSRTLRAEARKYRAQPDRVSAVLVEAGRKIEEELGELAETLQDPQGLTEACMTLNLQRALGR